MPEAPELEVIKDYLNERILGVAISNAQIVKPSVTRSFAGEFGQDIQGRTFEKKVERRGKFMLYTLSGDRLLVINNMLTGAFQYCAPAERKLKSTCFVLSLSNGKELRYIDEKQMGRVYYLQPAQMELVPQINEYGPDVPLKLTFEEFKLRLRPFRGEIKGVLTNGRFISGIGNAYVDEILFAAKVYPFKKCTKLSDDELRRIHTACREVIIDAIAVVRERIGDKIHIKIRDFLKVHNKGGQPCPRCGATITEITANQRLTSYCRQCQPGMLIKS